MKFFIDSSNIEEIRQAKELSVLDGVTTNPSLIAKTGQPARTIITQICEICTGPVSWEVLALDYATMMKEAREIAKLAPNLVVKIPLTKDGLQTVASCTEEGIKTNVTLCFNSIQALLAAKAGATYISPFVGRLDDIGHEGLQCIREIKQIYQNYNFPTQILAASIRHPLHIRDAALAGADVATVPFSIFNNLLRHPLTRDGLDQFMLDAARIPNR